MYKHFFKRFFDFMISLTAILIISPILLVMAIVGAIAMKGNPFFCQLRPGKKDKNGNERIFRLIKFRTMSNAKDKDGNVKYASATGAKGYRWMEAEMVKTLGKEDDIDRSYYDKLVNSAMETIDEYGDAYWFVG